MNMKKVALMLFICVIYMFMLNSTSRVIERIDHPNYNYQSPNTNLSKILYGKWKILCPYAVLPEAANFNQFESFQNYPDTFDDPLVKEFVALYDLALIGRIIEFSNQSFIQNDIDIFLNPEYEITKVYSHIYSDPAFGRYRPFSDFFKEFDMNIYYKFSIRNYNVKNDSEYELKPIGFIISENYIICSVHDDWVYYVLEKLQ